MERLTNCKLQLNWRLKNAQALCFFLLERSSEMHSIWFEMKLCIEYAMNMLQINRIKTETRTYKNIHWKDLKSSSVTVEIMNYFMEKSKEKHVNFFFFSFHKNLRHDDEKALLVNSFISVTLHCQLLLAGGLLVAMRNNNSPQNLCNTNKQKKRELNKNVIWREGNSFKTPLEEEQQNGAV